MRKTHDNVGTPHRRIAKSPRRRILIAVVLVVGVGLICWALAMPAAFDWMFLYFVVSFYIPLGLVMVVDGILLGLVLKAFRRHRLELPLLLVLWFGQTTVLIAWTIRITASDAFLTVPEKYLTGSWNLYGTVIDSHFQETFMTVFWYAAAGIGGIVVSAALVRLGILLHRRRKPQRGAVWRVLTLVLTVLILARMRGDVREFHRMGASLADTTSPDGGFDVRLVPINAFADVNGVIMFRQAGSLWWYPMATVGDQLTFDQDNIRLIWDSNTQVRLLVGDEPSGTYDLTTGSDISRSRSRVPPRSTCTGSA